MAETTKPRTAWVRILLIVLSLGYALVRYYVPDLPLPEWAPDWILYVVALMLGVSIPAPTVPPSVSAFAKGVVSRNKTGVIIGLAAASAVLAMQCAPQEVNLWQKVASFTCALVQQIVDPAYIEGVTEEDQLWAGRACDMAELATIVILPWFEEEGGKAFKLSIKLSMAADDPTGPSVRRAGARVRSDGLRKVRADKNLYVTCTNLASRCEGPMTEELALLCQHALPACADGRATVVQLN